MPRKDDSASEDNNNKILPSIKKEEDDVSRLNRMLAAVMKYISDDEIVEIDIDFLLDSTEGLRKWWDEYRERDRKRMVEEIKKSLSGLSLEELVQISEQIKRQEG